MQMVCFKLDYILSAPHVHALDVEFEWPEFIIEALLLTSPSFEWWYSKTGQRPGFAVDIRQPLGPRIFPKIGSRVQA